MAPTDVCITIDTEFSIGGAFDDPDLLPVSDPAVRCTVAGKDHGLGFLLDLFARAGVKATFFVEALNAAYYGPDRMGRYARQIAAAGHDVQLHVHPCWLHLGHADWKSRCADGPFNDSCSGRSLEEMRIILGYGLQVFEQWGLPRPIAVRTGNLQIDRTVHRVMAELGLKLSSSVGLAYWRPEEALHLYGGTCRVGRVMEVPVLSFGGYPGERLLTVTGTGPAEARAVLRRARGLGISPIVLLTHPFEFAKVADRQYGRLTPNRINQGRLEAFVRFVMDNPQDFAFTVFAAAADRWAATEAAALRLQAPLIPSAMRIAANALNDSIWRL
jgi:peptidoglycan/xylan/chitin deacetylase (PgdA/CDA1 family)